MLAKTTSTRRGESLNDISVPLVRATESPPLRLFVPHLCHAACRIVVMAEDTKKTARSTGVVSGSVMTKGGGHLIFLRRIYSNVSGFGTVCRWRGGWKIKSGVINKGVCMCRKAFRYVRSPVWRGRRRDPLLLLLPAGRLGNVVHVFVLSVTPHYSSNIAQNGLKHV